MPDVQAFLDRWRASQAAERANYQGFLIELCDVLGVPRPDPATGEAARDAYVFERPVAFHDSARQTTGFIDLYHRERFVLETKQGADAASNTKRAGHGQRETAAWERALGAAKQQAQRYAQNLGAGEPVPPFLVVVDVGYCLDLYADFSGTGRLYTPFPDARRFRIPLEALAREDVRETLRLIWTDPAALDPTRRQARVTRALAVGLARLAASLEATTPQADRAEVPRFLTRCLFCLFAEDAGLLPERAFTRLLASYREALDVLPMGLEAFFRTLDTGGFSPDVRAVLPPFNGALFSDARALPLTLDQLDALLEAAAADWHDVEPAIFGTLLERALDPRERHKLGAHFTPRAYVERLVVPTVIEPLRREWEATQAALALVERAAEQEAARKTEGAARERGTGTRARNEAVGHLRAFLTRLTSVRVLDPACGSGNFLYVTLDHLKRLEAEVRRAMERYGAGALEMEGAAVTPANLLGLEVNPQAAAVADLVLWIGYLQWHLRTYGSPQTLPRPILRAFGNIRATDAVLAWDEVVPRMDASGQAVTRWDGVTTRTHPATGREVPDETARTSVLDFVGARPADPWPEADFVVGNPPFVGAGPMREALGDGYVEALRRAYPNVPDSADFVMFWWERAAEAVRAGRADRFGFITTNSIRQTFNRRVLARHMEAEAPLSLSFAIPDHPWVDSANGAAVRIAMTVGVPGDADGVLVRVTRETEHDEDDAVTVETTETRGRINADLTVGVDVTQAQPLRANEGLSSPGMKLHGSGFIVTPEEATALGLGSVPGAERVILPYRNGKDLTARPRGVYVIDLFGHMEDEVRTRFPAIYQHVFTRVKPERDANNRATYRDTWWMFGEPRKAFRPALAGLPRYIATVETAKHRTFQFLDAGILPDNMLVVIASDDAYHLGVLSSRVHVTWALAAGGRLGMGNDPRYNKTRCFEPFPFPAATEAQIEEIRALGEALDAHRKARQDAHPALTLTDLYNVVEKLRRGDPLTEKERATHDAGLASVLLDLHTRLDAAVLRAYDWPEGLSDEDVLARLVALNAERRAEEAAGRIRYLRPAYQAPKQAAPQGALTLPAEASETPAASLKRLPWPDTLGARMQAVRAVVEAAPGPCMPGAIAGAFEGVRLDEVAPLLSALTEMGLLHESVAGQYTP